MTRAAPRRESVLGEDGQGEGKAGGGVIWLTADEGHLTGAAVPSGVSDGTENGGTIPTVAVPSLSMKAAGVNDAVTHAFPLPAPTPSRISDAASKQEETVASSRRESATGKGRLRTHAIEKALGADGARVYSPKPQRDKLFKALHFCLPKEGPAKTLLQLTREIRQQASRDAEDADFLFWHPATQGFVGMLLGAGVLRDEMGNRVHDGLFARSSRILSFDEPIEDICEAFLLETAITEMADVTDGDKVPLAHALFWDRDCSDRDQVEERLEHVLRLLEGRLAVTVEGVWYMEARLAAAKSED